MHVNLHSFIKFVFFFFVFEMVLIQNSIYKPSGTSLLFYPTLGLMALSILLIINRLNVIPWQILFYVGLLWVYFLLFDITSFDGLLYLLSKTVVLLFLSYFSFSLIKNQDWAVFTTIKNILLCLMIASIIKPDLDAGRATGIFTNANELGAIAVITLLFVINLPSRLIMLLFSAGLCISLVMLSQSRAAFISMLIALMLTKRFSKKLKIASIIILAVIMSIFAFSFDILERFQSGNMIDTRQNEWSVAQYVISERPILGSGLASYDGMSRLYLDVYKETKALGAHNGYLSLCIMIGIPGTLLLISVLLSPLVRQLCRSATKQDTLYILSLSGCLLMFVLGMAESIFTGVNSLSANIYLFLYILFLYYVRQDAYVKISF